MIRTVYRGIGLREAMNVVSNQRYERDERRIFRNGVAAKAVFGPGIYLVSDVEMAAAYAYCHAEAENDLAAVLCQQLALLNPFLLNEHYGEKRLRQDALAWKYPNGDYPEIAGDADLLQVLRWSGEIIREYILHLQCDGIMYHVHSGLVYYVSYVPDRQISDIFIDFVFDIDDLRHATFRAIRERYKQKNKYS
ncbi:hypothetical protein BSNK01_25630 [Bacillaceae bacterium]